jgi:hypothetical protein
MVKKAEKKKAVAKRARARMNGESSEITGEVKNGLVERQPEIKDAAAIAHEMFLFTDDAWAQRYFDRNDLHFLEREVFG